jgi:hypothetical protein
MWNANKCLKYINEKLGIGTVKNNGEYSNINMEGKSK